MKKKIGILIVLIIGIVFCGGMIAYREGQGTLAVYGENKAGEKVLWRTIDKGKTTDWIESYMIESGGTQREIYTAIDIERQALLERMFADFSVFSNTKQIENMKAVMIILNNEGKIVAMADRGHYDANPYLATYKIGSTIKPLGVYSLAIEENQIHYSTQVLDAPSIIKEGDKQVIWPRNNKNSRYGELTIEEAVSKSLNTIPVQLGISLTTDKCYNFLKDEVGFSTLTEEDNSLSAICLGEFSEGILLQELANRFQVFSRGGKYTPYTVIEKSAGHKPTEVSVMSEETATIMNRLLSQVVEREGGTGVHAKMDLIPVIGKTGTSDEEKDYLFVGSTPYYTSVLWLGYDLPGTHSPRYNHHVTRIWNIIMEQMHKGLGQKEFTLSDEVEQLNFCDDTGLLSSKGCKVVRRGYYKEGHQPNRCHIH